MQGFYHPNPSTFHQELPQQQYIPRGRGGGRGRGAMNQLPLGWQTAYTNEGQLYFIDHNTRTTHWQLPPHIAASMSQGGFGQRGRGIDQGKRKTKMCMNFENGTCSWGDTCAFAHGPVELVRQQEATGPQQQGVPQQEGAVAQQLPPPS